MNWKRVGLRLMILGVGVLGVVLLLAIADADYIGPRIAPRGAMVAGGVVGVGVALLGAYLVSMGLTRVLAASRSGGARANQSPIDWRNGGWRNSEKRWSRRNAEKRGKTIRFPPRGNGRPAA